MECIIGYLTYYLYGAILFLPFDIADLNNVGNVANAAANVNMVLEWLEGCVYVIIGGKIQVKIYYLLSLLIYLSKSLKLVKLSLMNIISLLYFNSFESSNKESNWL